MTRKESLSPLDASWGLAAWVSASSGANSPQWLWPRVLALAGGCRSLLCSLWALAPCFCLHSVSHCCSQQHPALPGTGRKHERRSCVNPSGLDCGAAFNCRITHNLLHHATHQTARSANSSCVPLSCCLHVYLKELTVNLFKSTSNGKWQQTVLRAIVRIPKAWM